MTNFFDMCEIETSLFNRRHAETNADWLLVKNIYEKLEKIHRLGKIYILGKIEQEYFRKKKYTYSRDQNKRGEGGGLLEIGNYIGQ